MKKIKSALVSVYYKDQLAPLVQYLHQEGAALYSTGGTYQFIESLGIPVQAVESLTGYPSIFGGRVKTLHPAVFGGILQRRDLESDQREAAQYQIPAIDLVVVDLYPFEQTVASGAGHQEIIEKIDIGGVSLIRAAAKNYQDVAIVSSKLQYGHLLEQLQQQGGCTTEAQRAELANQAFHITSHYDTAIFHYFQGLLPAGQQQPILKLSSNHAKVLRYGENPHQKGFFFGDLTALFDQLSGKELSYNNLLDVDAAVNLIAEFPEAEGKAFCILKHNNACGAALGATCLEAYQKALAADPVSAFGGVLVTNTTVDLQAAQAIHQLFMEVLVAPNFTEEALALLTSKKNRILLRQKNTPLPSMLYRTLLNGTIAQEKDALTEKASDLKPVTQRVPTEAETAALLFANKLVKHTKSNTIVLASADQLYASGTGQTSRVDAMQQAIHKAQSFGFDLSEAVMASDAFFPFPDCVEIAHHAGIKAVIQPGGSIKDKDSIEFCDAHGMAMVFTGIRHFRH